MTAFVDFEGTRKLSENHRCAECDLGDDMVAEIKWLRQRVEMLENLLDETNVAIPE